MSEWGPGPGWDYPYNEPYSPEYIYGPPPPQFPPAPNPPPPGQGYSGQGYPNWPAQVPAQPELAQTPTSAPAPASPPSPEMLDLETQLEPIRTCDKILTE